MACSVKMSYRGRIVVAAKYLQSLCSLSLIKMIIVCLLSILIMTFLEKKSEFHNRHWTDPTEGQTSRESSRLHQWTLCKNVTDGTDLIHNDSTSSPKFIQELLPSVQRTALLNHMSYLCLGKVPKLERLLREQAIETQLLFGSSEALLMKCVGTSENFVTSLLPNLKVAVEKNKPQLALKFLEKAKDWISDIIKDVKDIVKRYDKYNSDVASSTSDFITEKKEMMTTQQKQTSEMKEHQKIIDGLEANLGKISKEIEDYEKKIDKKNSEIQKFIIRITINKEEKATGPSFGHSTYLMMVPFVESIVSFIYKTMTSTTETDQIMALHADLSETTKAQRRLKEREWDIQNQLMDNQLMLAKLKIETGQLPSAIHLVEVQKCLSQIQQILVQLQKFWEKVGSLLDMLKERTFAGEIWIDDLNDLKEEFLDSIDAAKEEWTQFGINSMKAYNIFSVQSNKAYRFLEISPSSLSEEEWEKEYESVKEKLQNIRPNAVNPAAITP